MGSILLGDLEEQLPGAVDLSTCKGREKAAAGRLSVLMMVMVTRSLHETATAREAADDLDFSRREAEPITLSHNESAHHSCSKTRRRQRA